MKRNLLLTASLAMSAVFLPQLAAAANVSCGDTIDGISVVLDGNVGPCSGTAVTLKNGAVLDMNTYRIACENSSSNIGVSVQGGTLQNGLIGNCHTACVEVTGSAGSDASVVERVTAYASGGTGFRIIAEEPATVENCAAYGMGTDAFYVSGAEHKLTNNSVVTCGEAAFQIAADGASLSGNRATDCQIGFEVQAAAKLKGNSSVAEDTYDFSITGNGSSLVSNTAMRSSVGFRITGNGNRLKKNRSYGQGSNISVDGDANVVTGNIVAASSIGIALQTGATNSVIRKNLAAGNLGTDLYTYLPGCGSNIVQSNLGNSNDACLD